MSVIEVLVIGIVSTVVVVVIPLAYSLRSVISKHKTLLGKVTAVINYLKANPTTDTQLEGLVESIIQVIAAVK